MALPPFLVCGSVLWAASPGTAGSHPSAAAEPTAPAPAPRVDPPADLLSLLPDSALAYVQFESAAAIDAMGDVFVDVFSPDEEQPRATESLLGSLIDVEQIDATLPIGVALGLDLADFESIVGALVVPVAPEQRAAFLAGVQAPAEAPEPIAHGRYVAVPLSERYVRGTGTRDFARGLLPGTVTGRVDLEPLVAAARPLIDLGLMQARTMADAPEFAGMADFDMVGLMELYFEGLANVMDSAGSLELALSVTGTELDLVGALTAIEDSVMAEFMQQADGGGAELGALLASGGMASFVTTGEVSLWYEEFGYFFEELATFYPEGLRSMMEGSLQAMNGMLSLMGSGAGGTVELSGGRYSGSYLTGSEDPAGTLQRFEAMVNAGTLDVLGAGSSAARRAVAGVELVTTRLRFDPEMMFGWIEPADPDEYNGLVSMMEALYGTDGIELALAAVGSTVLLSYGQSDAEIARAIEAARSAEPAASPALAEAVAQLAGARAGMAVELDLARYVLGILSLVSTMDPDLEVAPIDEGLQDLSAPMAMYAAVQGRVWRGGLSVDLADLAQMDEFGMLLDR